MPPEAIHVKEMCLQLPAVRNRNAVTHIELSEEVIGEYVNQISSAEK